MIKLSFSLSKILFGLGLSTMLCTSGNARGIMIDSNGTGLDIFFEKTDDTYNLKSEYIPTQKESLVLDLNSNELYNKIKDDEKININTQGGILGGILINGFYDTNSNINNLNITANTGFVNIDFTNLYYYTPSIINTRMDFELHNSSLFIYNDDNKYKGSLNINGDFAIDKTSIILNKSDTLKVSGVALLLDHTNFKKLATSIKDFKAENFIFIRAYDIILKYTTATINSVYLNKASAYFIGSDFNINNFNINNDFLLVDTNSLVDYTLSEITCGDDKCLVANGGLKEKDEDEKLTQLRIDKITLELLKKAKMKL